MRHDKTVKVARKKCDKFITPTVRVSTCIKIKTVTRAENCQDIFESVLK